MDCRTFRKHHVAYLDDTLPGELLVTAERHRLECAGCASHDTAVRRALLLARNLPRVELSADFSARLAARLDDVRCGRAAVPDDGVVPFGDEWAPNRFDAFRAAVVSPAARRRLAAVAAGLVALTYAGDRARQWNAETRDAVLAPVLATAPEVAPLPDFVPPALLTGASTGIPVWPAALLADQAPTRMVGAQLLLASW